MSLHQRENGFSWDCMKVVRCSDQAYAGIAELASQRHLSMARVVEELVAYRGPGLSSGEGQIDELAETFRTGLREFLGDADEMRGGLAGWVRGVFQIQMSTDTNVNELCRANGLEPKSPHFHE